MRHIDSSKGRIATERCHAESLTVEYILFANLDEDAIIGDGKPGLVQKLTSEAIQDYITAMIVSSGHHTVV